MSVEEIYNALAVDDRLITSGQPSEDQLRVAAAEGIDTVVNLAPHDAHNALPDEAGLVHALGMTYHHLPVVFANPTEADFAAFDQVMAEMPPESRTLVHCAANFRVSAFYGLYAMKRLGWSVEQAEAFRAPIWEGSDYPVWEAFISQMQQRLTGAAWTVERHLAGRTQGVSDLYAAFVQALATCGPFEVSVSKTAIAFKGARRGFAGVRPTASGLSGFIDLQRRVDSPRFSRVSRYTSRLFVHRFRLTSLDEVDDEFTSWLREAYAVGAGAHLESPGVKRSSQPG